MPHLWYPIQTHEQRRAALDEVVNLRVDPHVFTLNASPLLAAIRDHREVGGLDLTYRPGYDRPSFMTVGSSTRPLSLNDTFPIRALSLPHTTTDPETAHRIIEEFARQMRGAQDRDRDRLSHPNYGSSLGSIANPLRRNIDYSSVSRRTFFVDSLPEPTPDARIYHEPPLAPPNWPEWCREGVTVYYREDGYRPMTITKVEMTVTVSGEGEEDEFYVFYPRDLVELVTPVKPSSRWELLSDED